MSALMSYHLKQTRHPKYLLNQTSTKRIRTLPYRHQEETRKRWIRKTILSDIISLLKVQSMSKITRSWNIKSSRPFRRGRGISMRRWHLSRYFIGIWHFIVRLKLKCNLRIKIISITNPLQASLLTIKKRQANWGGQASPKAWWKMLVKTSQTLKSWSLQPSNPIRIPFELLV